MRTALRVYRCFSIHSKPRLQFTFQHNDASHGMAEKPERSLSRSVGILNLWLLLRPLSLQPRGSVWFLPILGEQLELPAPDRVDEIPTTKEYTRDPSCPPVPLTSLSLVPKTTLHTAPGPNISQRPKSYDNQLTKPNQTKPCALSASRSRSRSLQ
ncbi:hypothetical protein EJ03DRAFT_155286 [Teratosphaeria nubilosa]|uniref:Uncharacterized protein n=1 Tax=Teratosphaeria nubilosa TaxID=161662 RepID=A0A6G1LL61_9PEZI|nr:hypothetical protein EJ03DRAFT_155286 [Teratosphaeria nubilosa]